MNPEQALEILEEVFRERVDVATEQRVQLLPSDVEVDAERYRAFAEGVRAGMGAHIALCEGMTGPAEFFLTDLLRDPSLSRCRR